MKLVVGLGNPGKQYESTRHNAGFLAVDFYLRGKEKISCRSKFHGQICEMHFHATSPNPSLVRRGKETTPLLSTGEKPAPHRTKNSGAGVGVKIFFIKPLSFMNKSGEVVKAVCNFYKLDPTKDLLVIHDDKDLKLGYYKITLSSSGAGHNGVQSLIEELGTQEFARIRIGIESRLNTKIPATEDFVLQKLPAAELAVLQAQIFPQVSEEVEKFILN